MVNSVLKKIYGFVSRLESNCKKCIKGEESGKKVKKNLAG
jgi:hypothetical protein